MSFQVSFRHGLYVLLALFLLSCSKSDPPGINSATGSGGSGSGSGSGGGSGNNPPPAQTSLVKAFPDITIDLPLNAVMLQGRVWISPQMVSRQQWTKISGPASGVIERPDSLYTRVSNLEAGTYLFRFQATTITGVVHADTVTVQVQPASSPLRQITFSGLDWSCPMGCGIWLGYMTPYFSLNTPLSVSIKRGGTSAWVPVLPDTATSPALYNYNLLPDLQLFVFENVSVNLTDQPEIRISF